MKIYTFFKNMTAVSALLLLVTASYAQPANDECSSATTLTIATSCTPVAGSTENATASNVLPDPDCGPSASNIDDDVWYKFTTNATQTSVSITFESTGGDDDMTAQIYSSADGSCDNLSLVDCSDDEELTMPGFTNVTVTPNTTYYIRTYTYSTEEMADFTICVEEYVAPPIPVNDECAGAIAFPTIPTNGTCASIVANTIGATQSQVGCAGTADDDVWYSFVCPTGVDSILFANTDISGNSDRVIEFFSGSCGALTSIKCSDVESGGLGGLTSGATYYFRIYTYSSEVSTSVNVCLKAPPPPLTNDDASGAIALTVGSGCTGAPYTNEGATQGSDEPYPQINSAGYSTVWYSFAAPASGAVRISTDIVGNTLTDSRVGLYEATDINDYSTFNIIAADDDGGSVSGSYMSVVYATGLTSGATYYIQVGGYTSSTAQGTFCLTVDELTDTMLSNSTACASNNRAVGSGSFTGWVPLLDNQSKLIALVRNIAGGSANDYSVSENLNTSGTVRTDANSKPYLDRNINISNTQVTTPVEVQLFFLDDELDALIAADPDATDLNDMNITKVSGDCTNDFVANGATPELLTQTSNGSVNGVSWIAFTTSGFSNFFVNSGTEPLPIEMKRIIAKNNGSVNDIEWETAKEDVGDYFELERSGDGKAFASIAKINSNGVASKYEYIDEKPLAGINYYRLRLWSADGSSSYSEVVNATVNFSDRFTFTVSPNPVKNQLNVLTSGSQNGQLVLTDISGKVLETIQISGSNTTIDMSKFASGLYFVKYSDNDNSQTIKVTKE